MRIRFVARARGVTLVGTGHHRYDGLSADRRAGLVKEPDQPMSRWNRCSRLLALAAAMAISPSPGCVEHDASESRARAVPAPAMPPPSDWAVIDDSPQVAMLFDEGDTAWQEAIRRARSTIDDARRQWEQQETTAARARWWLRWAAPTTDNAVELVWVRPVSWSAFRIEGHLASPPQRPLSCGKGQGDLVGFPVEDLVDWLHLLEGDFDGPREGGFTVELLEQRHGRSGPAGPS